MTAIRGLFALTLTLTSLFGVGCQRSPWEVAESQWQARDPSAYAAWRALDGSVPDAQRRLARADEHFRRGIALLATDDAGARAELQAGFADGPIDPALYLPLARACASRDLSSRAADLYRKFLRYAPTDAATRAAAERELATLERDALDGVFDEPADSARVIAWYAGSAGVIVLSIAAIALVWSRQQRRGGARGLALAELAEHSPELQPAIAFLLGHLRHELLKHRVLAIGDAVAAVGGDHEQSGQLRFLLTRLYGGEPLVLAWTNHLRAFLRALGPRFDLVRTDDTFAATDRAFHRLVELNADLEAKRPAAFATLRREFAALVAFDRYLSTLLASLTRLRIDRALLVACVDEVTAERVTLPPVQIAITDVADAIDVEIFRVDFLLMLRNLLRNACAAAADGRDTPRVMLRLAVELEPTGEEVVELQLHDSSPRAVPVQVAPRSLGRGLDLVLRVLDRVGGTLAAAAPANGYQKAVVLRLFRSFVATTDAASTSREASS